MSKIANFLILCVTFGAGLGLGLLRSNNVTPAAPEPVRRSFILWLPREVSEQEWPNFQRSISLMLFAQMGGSEQAIFTFGDDLHEPEALRGSHWITYQSQLSHVTRGGPIIYPASWKDEAAPFGAKAESTTITGEIYWIKKVSGSDDSPHAVQSWQISTEQDPDAKPVFVGSGLFSR